MKIFFEINPVFYPEHPVFSFLRALKLSASKTIQLKAGLITDTSFCLFVCFSGQTAGHVGS